MLLKALTRLAPDGMQIEIAEIGDLPLYNQDGEVTFPISAQELKGKIEKAGGIIVATPEYNRSIPGVLKNAIDWVSRPWGENSFAGKPILIAGVSVGKIGTAVAQSHLRQIMLYLDANVVGQPELYLTNDIFSAGGTVDDESAKKLLSSALSVLANRAAVV